MTDWLGMILNLMGAARARLLSRARVCMILALAALMAVEAGRVGAVESSIPVPVGAVPASRAAKNLAIITLDGEIHAVTSHSIKRRLQQAVDAGADGIVIDIDSPGGEVYAITDICTAIKTCPIRNTIAWVHPRAFSGGAVVALACREIVLAPGATMGDAGVIGGDPLGFAFMQGLKPTERAKGLSVILPELIDSARRNGYDEMLVQAFATLGVELWMVRDTVTGETHCVTEQEYRAIFASDPPRGSPSVGSGGLGKLNEESKARGESQDYSKLPSSSGQEPVETDETREFRPAAPELDNQDIRDAVNMRVEAQTRRPDFFAPGASDRYELVEYVTDGNVLLTLKEDGLKRLGFADPSVTIATDEQMKQYVGAANLSRVDQSWSETFVAFMTQGFSGLVTRGLLIVVFLMAMFIEMSVPGIGLAGGVALLALVGLVVPPMLIGASSWWSGAMILGGVGLLLLELFVMPGFGVPGVVGVVMLFAGLVGTFAGTGQLFPGAGPGGAGELAWALSIVLLAMFVSGAGIYFFTRYTHKFPIAGRLVLADRQMVRNEDEGMLAAMSPLALPKGPVAMGAVGRATTTLRPSGTAEFGDKLIDVVAEFGFIESGSTIRVTSVSEYRVGVDLVRDPADGTAKDGGPNLRGEA